MELHISNTEAARLAYQQAAQTGLPVDEVVLRALKAQAPSMPLKEQWTAEQAEALLEEIREVRKHATNLPILDPRPIDEILYDEYGLPK